MDTNSALMATKAFNEEEEAFNEEEEAFLPNKVDLNSPKSKEELKHCTNEDYSSLPVPSDHVNDEEQSRFSEPSLARSSSPLTESEDNGKDTFDQDNQKAEIPIEDYNNLTHDYDTNDLNHSPKDYNDGTMNGTDNKLSIEPQLERIEVNDEMVWENSPRENRNASLSPERRLSISAERSPSRHSPRLSPTSSKQDEPFMEKSGLKLTPSPQSLRKQSSLSQDQLSPSKSQKSPSKRASKREFRDRDDSTRRRLSRSPVRRESPRMRERSASRSPLRRRGSPARQRDRRRSRSESPIARNRNRRSPRRPSPRRRSPPAYHSRQRSSRRPRSPPNNRSAGVGRPGKNLFIAGFSYGTTEKDLEKKFSKFGRITNVRIVRDKMSGDSRGFGFLSMERDDDADAAIRTVDQTEWNGRVILVEKSKTFTR